MRLTKQLTFLPAFLFMIACAYGQDVHYNYARGTNFSSYKTYQWVDTPSGGPKLPSGLPDPPSGLPNLPIGPPPNILGGSSDGRVNVSDDQLLDQDVKRAVDGQLAQKGLTKVEKGGDLQVQYQAGVHEEKSINLFGSGWGDRGYGGMWDGSIQGQTSTIPIGGLVVGIYDPARKQLIWRGDASKTVDLKKDPNKNYKNLEKAVAKLFKNYPPPPNK